MRLLPTLYAIVSWRPRQCLFVTHGDSTLLRLCDGEVLASGMELRDCVTWFDAVTLSCAALSILLAVSKNPR
jgi:hypothetical protein